MCGLGLELRLMVLVSTRCGIGLVLSKLVSRPNIFKFLIYNVIVVFAVSTLCTIKLHPYRPQQHANKTISQVLKQSVCLFTLHKLGYCTSTYQYSIPLIKIQAISRCKWKIAVKVIQTWSNIK